MCDRAVNVKQKRMKCMLPSLNLPVVQCESTKLVSVHEMNSLVQLSDAFRKVVLLESTCIHTLS